MVREPLPPAFYFLTPSFLNQVCSQSVSTFKESSRSLSFEMNKQNAEPRNQVTCVGSSEKIKLS